MGDLLTFQPAKGTRFVRTPVAPDRAEVRAALELALEKTLDAAVFLVAQLDQIDGDPAPEPSGDDEPSLAAPIGGASQTPWAAGGTDDLEAALTRLGSACRVLPTSEPN